MTMGWLIFDICLLVGGYALGVATAKNLKRFLVKFHADPVGSAQNEIKELHAIIDRLKRK